MSPDLVTHPIENPVNESHIHQSKENGLIIDQSTCKMPDGANVLVLLIMEFGQE